MDGLEWLTGGDGVRRLIHLARLVDTFKPYAIDGGLTRVVRISVREHAA